MIAQDIPAHHKECISRVIYGAASIYGGEIKVYPQYEISGSHGKGPVDWAIKVENIIITVTEAKKEDINQGIAQSAIQLQTSIQRNPKKRTYDTAGLHEEFARRRNVRDCINCCRLGNNQASF